MRLVVTVLVAAGLGLGQFQELATTTDGSLVYFSSNFRLRGSGESLASKVFMIDGTGAHLIASRNGRFAALYSTTALISFGYAPTVVDLFTGNRTNLQSLLTSIPAVASNGTLLAWAPASSLATDGIVRNEPVTTNREWLSSRQTREARHERCYWPDLVVSCC